METNPGLREEAHRKPSERNLGAKTMGSILEFPISTNPK
jgi:hypothetical protein